jgi:hypothetical protein
MRGRTMQSNQGLARRRPSGHDNPAGLAYCGTCGASLSEPPQPSQPPGWSTGTGPTQTWMLRREVQLALLAGVAVVLLLGALLARNLPAKLGILGERHTISGSVTVADFSNVGHIDSPDGVAVARARLNALRRFKQARHFPVLTGPEAGSTISGPGHRSP